MTSAILKWLGGHDTGASSKALALTALGEMPDRPSHPHDGADFGRCHRLIQAAPEARKALDVLATNGGAYWAALVPRWTDIERAFEAEAAGDKGATYKLMREILAPVENADRRFIRLGPNVSMRVGR